MQAGFLSYQHAGPPADAVYTRNALHQLPDFWKAVALDRIAAMVRPGGVLRLHDLVYDFQPSLAEAVFERWLAGAADDPARGYTREDLTVGLPDERDQLTTRSDPRFTRLRSHVYAQIQQAQRGGDQTAPSPEGATAAPGG